MQIGNVNIDVPLVLAPMAGVTDAPFRQIVKDFGCGLLVSEMISSKGLLYKNQKTFELMDFVDAERPFAIQLFGSDPKEIARAAVKVAQLQPDIIDINMGCPVPKVVKNNEGSALLKEPKLVYEIVAYTVDAVKIPVTIKIRSGWDEKSINAPEVALLAQKAGASAVAIHARTREQFYSGFADWQIIKDVVSAVDIPVIGNGDVKTPQDALSMMQKTGCQAVMIGRAAEGNPWLFEQTRRYLKTGEILPEPSIEEKFALIKRHLQLLIECKGECIAIKQMRRHVATYIKGLFYATEYRNLFNNCCTEKEFLTLLDEYLLKIKSSIS